MHNNNSEQKQKFFYSLLKKIVLFKKQFIVLSAWRIKTDFIIYLLFYLNRYYSWNKFSTGDTSYRFVPGDSF